jgi:uncharacterized damage-inducible protein DinB
VFEAWADLDRATADLPPNDAERRIGDASPISWTVAHCTHMVDSWLNVNFQGKEPHPLLYSDNFRKGSTGDPVDWDDVQAAVREVRAAATPYLEAMTHERLYEKHAYTGSIEALRETGISPRFAMMRIAAHHYFHMGEIVAARATLGHDLGDFPGLMLRAL